MYSSLYLAICEDDLGRVTKRCEARRRDFSELQRRKSRRAKSAAHVPVATRSFIHDTIVVHSIPFSLGHCGEKARLALSIASPNCLRGSAMQEMKDTARATVRIGFDGRVHKTFRGHMAKRAVRPRSARAALPRSNAAARSCPACSKWNRSNFEIVTTNCGGRVDQLNPERQIALFAELEKFGVRHEDRGLRNITYRVGRRPFLHHRFRIRDHPRRRDRASDFVEAVTLLP